MLLTYTIDKEEVQDVAIINILNASIKTIIEHKEEMVILKTRGCIADLMLITDPDIYHNYKTVKTIREKI